MSLRKLWLGARRKGCGRALSLRRETGAPEPPEPRSWVHTNRLKIKNIYCYRPFSRSRHYRRTAGCLIKGNISSSGERIYHAPGQRYYDKTQINESKGERWFCTEQEVVRAGWRKAKV